MSAPPPADRDLRDARFEHDACGVAFVATTSGIASNHIVASALRALVNLGHRGATGADPDTGDAAGLDRRHLHIASLSSRTIVYKGMLTAEQLGRFYLDLGDSTVRSALAVVHARFSTNVLPRWDLAQPARMSAHNGEINTLRGNA